MGHTRPCGIYFVGIPASRAGASPAPTAYRLLEMLPGLVFIFSIGLIVVIFFLSWLDYDGFLGFTSHQLSDFVRLWRWRCCRFDASICVWRMVEQVLLLLLQQLDFANDAFKDHAFETGLPLIAEEA